MKKLLIFFAFCVIISFVFFAIKPEIGASLFVTPHLFIFAIYPFISIFIKNEDTKKLIYSCLIPVRLVFVFGINDSFAIDLLTFVGLGVIVNPLLCLFTHKKYIDVMNAAFSPLNVIKTPNNVQTVSNVSTADANNTPEVKPVPKKTISYANFEKMYSLPEGLFIETVIKKEMEKAKIKPKDKLIPKDILKRKKILNLIFSILVFVYITLIFFHFPIFTYILGIIILIVIFALTRKYDLMKFIVKEVKSRPGEKISNIIMNIKTTSSNDNTAGIFILSLSLAIVLPLIIFSSPRILYERTDGGYAVRYYIFGLTNYKTATIPDTYKGENVVSLRGNTFSNMPLLESVKLPDTIIEIRGQAFKNCRNLVEVNIPKNLEYLGGGAFYNARSIKTIELPDTLTYLGGEAFYGARSLETIRLSENLDEIRGDSFEYCTSLREIEIPDNVKRIGGHAFYGDTALSKVTISKDSQLEEIGSSAFRQCSSLASIIIPEKVDVNFRAFKESPTVVNKYESFEYDVDIDTYDEFLKRLREYSPSGEE